MKKNIAVIGGGDSSEYVISVKSAQQIAEMLDKESYNVYVILMRGNDWHVIGGECDNVPVNKADFSFTYNGKKIHFDCIYITIHGTPGEDGILPAYFDLIDIPHTTCDVMTSSLTFDKYFTKIFIKQLGISTAKCILVKHNEKVQPDKIANELSFPVFIKPSNGGSSFGTTKVNSAGQILPAIENAFKEDNRDVLIEKFIEGTEITCGMISTLEKKIALPPTEIVSHTGFFDFAAKYQGKSDEITPARISDQAIKKCQEITVKINIALNCRGITRTDYILRNGEFYFLEINTTPGMTKESIVPKQVRTMGLDMKDVLTWVVEDAINRKKLKRRSSK